MSGISVAALIEIQSEVMVGLRLGGVGASGRDIEQRSIESRKFFLASRI